MTYIYLIFQKSARIILQSYKKIYSIEHLSETANGIHKKAATLLGSGLKEIEVRGFEPPASTSRT